MAYIADMKFTYVVFGGDLNIDLDAGDNLCNTLLNFGDDIGVAFIDKKLPPHNRTFSIDSTGASSFTDHLTVI